MPTINIDHSRMNAGNLCHMSESPNSATQSILDVRSETRPMPMKFGTPGHLLVVSACYTLACIDLRRFF